MGIPGLLKMLKPYTLPVHVKKYSGKRVGIDAYCWLHKGAYACSFAICDGEQKISSMQPCMKYCMHYINLLRFNNVIPVVVFDGGRLPSKAFTENERQRRRDLNLEQARLKLSEGDVNGSQELCQRAVEITPLMAHEFIKVLKAEGVEFVVAPYEADAQLAYLSTLSPEKGGVDAVISEDSDLLAYGCSVVMYKMDRYGNGEEVRLEDVMRKKTTSEGPSNSLRFGCFTPELFTGMCVLAGCDFLASVPGIGIKRAHCLVCKYRDLARVLSSMRFDRKLVVPEGYELAFKQANAIFHHARVYDASARKLSFLKPLSAPFVNEFNGDLDFLGPDLPPSRALAIAQGRLNPISMCAFDELVWKEPSSPQQTQKEAKSTRGDSRDHPFSHKSMQGDVWLGTDEELIMLLAASEPKPSLSPLPTGACPLSLNVRPDNGFLAHLTSISNIKAAPPLEEQLPPASNSSIVILSPGKKRVLPPPPNNPFKRGKQSVFSLSSKARLLFDTEIDGKLLCREDQFVEKAIWVPHQASHEADQFSCIKHEVQRSIGTGDSVDGKAGGNPSSIFQKVVNFQYVLHSTTLAPLHVQDSEESQGHIDSSTGGAEVLIEAGTAGDTKVSIQSKLKMLQADSFGIRPVRGQYTSNSKSCMRTEPQASVSPFYQDSVVQQSSLESCAVSTSHCLLPMASHHMETGMGSPKTPNVTKQLQREAKAKKEIRCSSKQSSKVMMAASTPSLLKFFQRAPTL